MKYKNENLKYISFPLGGIGSGCIGLAGNGRLVDFEIENSPNNGYTTGFNLFALRAETEGKFLDARVINSDFDGSYMGGETNSPHGPRFGFGTSRYTCAAMPHFKDVTFDAKFPIAKLKFEDNTFPASVKLTAFNPFIPHNEDDSSIPAAFFEYEIKNTTDKIITYTLAGVVTNPHQTEHKTCILNQTENITALTLKNSKDYPDITKNGDITIAAESEDVSYQQYWYRGRLFDGLETFWSDFCAESTFTNRIYKEPFNGEDTATLANTFTLSPNEKKSIMFVISWNYPYRKMNNKPILNYYKKLFDNSYESAIYSLTNFKTLYSKTKKFTDTLFSSTIPFDVVEAISRNLSTLKSPTVMRLENGEFYGFEGCKSNEGSCEGSCTHVYNYAYSLPFLFPRLEQSMHKLNYKYNLNPDGSMNFRLQLPLGTKGKEFMPCVDGQFGGIIKLYRDFKISGDLDYLKFLWKSAKKSLDYAFSKENKYKWDSNCDGILEGRQHNTFDFELFSENAWLSGYYLAALKAASEISAVLNDKKSQDFYLSLFNKGKKYLNQNLFNGEYFIQKIDLSDKSLIEQYCFGESFTGDDELTLYWNEEKQQIKYQLTDGCLINQCSPQWHANISNLGEIFDKDKCKTALKSIFKYNFKQNMRSFFNSNRIYALNDESACVNCTWQQNRPANPLPYSSEVINGFEYQAAAMMIYYGMYDEGLTLIKSLNTRYIGTRRNPFSEIECGSNYVRSMASYSLLSAYSDFTFDMSQHKIGFKALNNNFKCFFSLLNVYGILFYNKNEIGIKITEGSINLKKLHLPDLINKKVSEVTVDNIHVCFTHKDDEIKINDTIIKKSIIIYLED